MLAFKLPVVILPVWLLVWYVFLPPFQSQPNTDYYASLLSSPADDFAAVAFQLGVMLFLPAGVLVVGGLIQLFCHSIRSAGWSLGFGIFALVISIALVCGAPSEHIGFKSELLVLSPDS